MPFKNIDLDHNATTPIDPEVVAAIQAAWLNAGGNPGSRHTSGRQARRLLEDARESIAAILGAKPIEVVFTSGGTESNNTAIRGFTQGSAGSIVATPGSHPSMESVILRRERQGWQRIELPVNQQGLIHLESLGEIDWPRVRLAAVLLAHNETGVVQPLNELSCWCRQHSVPLHVDAVQAVGKIPVHFRDLGAATLSLAAHKFHGPRGIGALLIRDGIPLPALFVGGHQERDHRAGTEPVALAAGMARALEIWQAHQTQIHLRLSSLRNRLESQLKALCPPVVVHGEGGERLPNTLNLAFPGCDGEALLVALDLAGICCSMGSTCASGSSEPAPILLRMGCSRELALASLRFSVGRTNAMEEIDVAADRIAKVVTNMRARRTGTSGSEIARKAAP